MGGRPRSWAESDSTMLLLLWLQQLFLIVLMHMQHLFWPTFTFCIFLLYLSLTHLQLPFPHRLDGGRKVLTIESTKAMNNKVTLWKHHQSHAGHAVTRHSSLLVVLCAKTLHGLICERFSAALVSSLWELSILESVSLMHHSPSKPNATAANEVWHARCLFLFPNVTFKVILVCFSPHFAR